MAIEVVFQLCLQTPALVVFHFVWFFLPNVTVARVTSLFVVLTHFADYLDHVPVPKVLKYFGTPNISRMDSKILYLLVLCCVC